MEGYKKNMSGWLKYYIVDDNQVAAFEHFDDFLSGKKSEQIMRLRGMWNKQIAIEMLYAKSLLTKMSLSYDVYAIFYLEYSSSPGRIQREIPDFQKNLELYVPPEICVLRRDIDFQEYFKGDWFDCGIINYYNAVVHMFYNESYDDEEQAYGRWLILKLRRSQ